MNGTDHFKRTIQAYLDSRAAEDKLFAASYSKPNKNMDDCITYLLHCGKSTQSSPLNSEQFDPC